MKKTLLALTVVGFLVGCGGGGGGSSSSDSSGQSANPSDNIGSNIPQSTNYTCDVGANIKASFKVEEIPLDFDKKSGIELVRYFFPKWREDHKEVYNEYIKRYTKGYFFGRFNPYEIKNKETIRMQTIERTWYKLGQLFGRGIDYGWGDHDKSWDIFSSVDLLRNIQKTDIVAYADVGDPILSYDDHGDKISSAKVCYLVDSAPSKSVGMKHYDDVITLSCVSTMLFNTIFTGVKTKIILAKDIGVVYQKEDTYQTTLKDTEETDRECTQTLIELTKSEVVPHLNPDELENK